MIASLIDLGVKIEVCEKAVIMSGESVGDVLEGIEVIQNAWISGILNQNKLAGYAYVTF